MTTRPANRKARHGFTLIEMIVATVLLAVGIAATMGAIASATHASGIAERYQKAALLAQKQIAQLELQPELITAGEQQGDFGDEYPDFRWKQNIETTEIQTLYRVTVSIQWGFAETPKERSFTTYLRYDSNAQNGTGNNANSQNGAGNQPPANGAGGAGGANGG